MIAINPKEFKKTADTPIYLLLDPLILKNLDFNDYKVLGNTQDFILIKKF